MDESNVDTVRDVAGDVASLDTIVTVGGVTSEGDEHSLSKLLTTNSATFETVVTSAEDDAVIIYTSGTTRDPKGVLRAHRVLLGNLPFVIMGFCNLELHDSNVFCTPSEWAWVATLLDVAFLTLYYGLPRVGHTGIKSSTRRPQ